MTKWLLCLLFLAGCSRSYVAVQRQKLDRLMLASTYVKSPDPLQAKPPRGERLIVKWRLPEANIDDSMQIRLSLLFKDFSVETIAYPVLKKSGLVTYELFDKAYKERGGLLSYKAEAINAEGVAIRSWQQQLWVDLIEPEEWDHDPELMPCGPTGLN